MIYFIGLFLTTIPLFLIEEGIINSGKNRKYIVWILFITSIFILIFIGYFRDISIGIDLKNYYHLFEINYRSFEKGYTLFIDVLRQYSSSFTMFKDIFSFLFPFAIGLFIGFVSRRKWLSLFLFQTLYLYVSTFSLLRQYLATVGIIIALVFIYHHLKSVENKWMFLGFSVIFILLSSLFHYSALFLLILPMVALVERRYILIIIYALFGLVLFFFRDPIIDFMLTTFFPTKGYYANFEPEIGLFPILQFSLILMNQFLYRIKSREDEFLAHEKEYLFVTNLAIVWLITIFTFSWFPNLARITMYISLIMCAFLPNFMKYKRTTYILIMLVLVAYYAFSLIYRDYQGVYPYMFMWEVAG